MLERATSCSEAFSKLPWENDCSLPGLTFLGAPWGRVPPGEVCACSLAKQEPEARSPSPGSDCGPCRGEGRVVGESQQETGLLALAPWGALSKSATFPGPSFPISTERGWVGHL